MITGFLCDLDAAKHSGNLEHPLVIVEGDDVGRGGLSIALLDYLKVLMPEGRDLGKVGDTEDLPGPAELSEQPADDLRHAPADPHIHLVKYQRRDLSRLDRGHLKRETDAGKFPSGSDPGERLQWLPRIGGDEKLHTAYAVGRGLL